MLINKVFTQIKEIRFIDGHSDVKTVALVTSSEVSWLFFLKKKKKIIEAS